MFKNATYRGIPCWYNPVLEEVKGKNWFFEILISINIWFDFNVLLIESLPLWVEVDESERP